MLRLQSFSFLLVHYIQSYFNKFHACIIDIIVTVGFSFYVVCTFCAMNVYGLICKGIAVSNSLCLFNTRMNNRPRAERTAAHRPGTSSPSPGADYSSASGLVCRYHLTWSRRADPIFPTSPCSPTGDRAPCWRRPRNWCSRCSARRTVFSPRRAWRLAGVSRREVVRSGWRGWPAAPELCGFRVDFSSAWSGHLQTRQS